MLHSAHVDRQYIAVNNRLNFANNKIKRRPPPGRNPAYKKHWQINKR